MIAIYYRVSTIDQKLASQEKSVLDWLAINRAGLAYDVYADHGISGSKSDRPRFQDLLTDTESKKISEVVVFKLDRLTRNAITAIKLVLRFDELGIKFTSVTQPMFSDGMPFRHAIIAIFAELAQMERDAIIERVNAGMNAARSKGKHLGRRPLDANIVAEIRTLKSKGWSFRRISKKLGVSIGTVYKYGFEI